MLELLNVLADQELTAADRVVYAVVDVFGDSESAQAMPMAWSTQGHWSMATLCYFTGLRSMAVRRAMKHLEARGWMVSEYDPVFHAWRLLLCQKEALTNG